MSRQVLDELVRAIRSKRPTLLPLLHTFLASTPPEVCADPAPHEVARARALINPADAAILAAAIQSGADCLVTGNTRHFTSEVVGQAGIAIFTPAEYVARLTRPG